MRVTLIILTAVAMAGSAIAQPVEDQHRQRGEQAQPSEQEQARRMLVPVCEKRAADLRAGREPAEYRTLLASLSETHRTEVTRICNSLSL